MSDKPTILLVDDEERILRSLKMLFRGRYNVLTTTDGNAVPSMLAENIIHVVISDQRMPNKTGVEVLRDVANISPATMRILLTGYSELDSIIGSVNEGEIFRFINKPWNPDELRETVERAVEIAIHTEAAAKTITQQAAKLQATQDVSAKPTASAAAPATATPTGPKVLLLDDDPKMLATLSNAVSGRFGLLQESSLEAAFKTLSEEDVAIVVSELRIKSEDIGGAIKSLKKHHPHILSIIVTAYKDNTALIDLINQGQVFRFFPKPPSEKLLLRSVEAAMRRYQAFQTQPELLQRYSVENTKKEEDAKVSGRIMGYLKRLRSRKMSTASA